MKTKKLLPIAFALVVMLQGCDKIEGPYSEGNNGGGVVDTSCADLTGIDSLNNDTLQRVLLEEYTGHTCTNCPAAHQAAQSLHALYGDQLVIVAIHCGSYARIESHPDSSYHYDWRTTTGNDIYGRYLLTSQSFPTGCVQRTKNSANIYATAHGAWGASIAPYITQKPAAKLRITNTYNAANRTITSTINTGFLKDIPASLNLTVLYTEDSIIKWQKNGSFNDPNYLHRHALRGTLNGSIGAVLCKSFLSGQSYTQTYSSDAMRSDIVPEHVSVVAILYNTNTPWEVVQVAEKKLLP